MALIPIEDINILDLRSAMKQLFEVGAITERINTYQMKRTKALPLFLNAMDEIAEDEERANRLTDEIIEYYNSLFTEDETAPKTSEDAPKSASNEKAIPEVGVEAESEEEDENLAPFIEAIDADIISNPNSVTDLDPELVAKADKLVEGVEIDNILLDHAASKKIDGHIVDKDVLLDILKTTKAATSKGSALTQMEHFIFSNNTVTSYNDDLLISQPLITGLNCSVNAADLLKIVNKTKEETVILKQNQNELSIISGSLESGLNILQGNKLEDLIREVLSDGISWMTIPEDFQDGAYLVSHSAATTTGASTLNCICVAESYIVACDRIRIGRYKMSEHMEDFMIRAAVVKELEHFSMNSYCVTDNWVHFKAESTGKRLSARRVLGSYADVADFFADYFGEEIKVPNELKGVIDSVSTIQNELVDITIKSGVLTCTAKKVNGWMKQSINVEQCPPAKFSVNPKMLSKALDGTHPTLAVGKSGILLTFGMFGQILYTVQGE